MVGGPPWDVQSGAEIERRSPADAWRKSTPGWGSAVPQVAACLAWGKLTGSQVWLEEGQRAAGGFTAQLGSLRPFSWFSLRVKQEALQDLGQRCGIIWFNLLMGSHPPLLCLILDWEGPLLCLIMDWEGPRAESGDRCSHRGQQRDGGSEGVVAVGVWEVVSFCICFECKIDMICWWSFLVISRLCQWIARIWHFYSWTFG